MSVTKSEAIMFLGLTISQSDKNPSNFKKEFMLTALKHPSFKDAVLEAESWEKKFNAGILNYHSAMNLVKSLPREERMEIIVIAITIAAADGEYHENEQLIINNIISQFDDISNEDVIAEIKKRI